MPSMSDLLRCPPPSYEDSSLEDKLVTIRSCHERLAQLWASKKRQMITAWTDLVIEDVRQSRCRNLMNGTVSERTLTREYPEVRFASGVAFFRADAGSNSCAHYISPKATTF